MTSYAVARREFFLGKELRFGEPAGKTIVRLSNDTAARWKRPVHEVWQTETPTRTLHTPLVHYSGTSVGQFGKKLNYYTDINSRHLFEQMVRTSWIEIVLYPMGKFVYNYFLKQGFRDGTQGFLHATFMSMHSFLTRAKLYVLNSRHPELVSGSNQYRT